MSDGWRSRQMRVRFLPGRYISRLTVLPLWRLLRPKLGRLMGVLAAFVVLAITIAILPSQILGLDLGPRRANLDPAELADATNGIRTALLQTLGGLVLISGAVATWRTLAVNREGQVTERFTRAIDQLGSETLDVRLGGIYGLERIARDSNEDREPVIRVLAAYLREHARIQAKRTWEARFRHPAVGSVKSAEEALELDPEGSLRADLQIAATVIGRSRGDVGPSHDPLVLSKIDLSPRLYLRRADLSYIDLSEAVLLFADLKWADVTRTDFTRADLRGVDFEFARTYGGAPKFRGADLRNSRLHGLDLGIVDLRGADLRKARFTSSFLLDEATADEERAAAEEQLRFAEKDESTLLPWDV